MQAVCTLGRFSSHRRDMVSAVELTRVGSVITLLVLRDRRDCPQ